MRGGRETVVLGIAVTVTAVWVIATLVQVLDPAREVPAAVNGIMGAVVSVLIGTSVASAARRGGKNGNGDDG
jgi:hypothetical protein